MIILGAMKLISTILFCFSLIHYCYSDFENIVEETFIAMKPIFAVSIAFGACVVILHRKYKNKN